MSSYGTPSKQVVNRLSQLRADKVCPPHRESPRSKDFPRCGGLYAEVASRFTPSKPRLRNGQGEETKKQQHDVGCCFYEFVLKF